MQTAQQMSLNIPLYVWPALAILVAAWIYVMLPERFKPKRSSSKEPKFQNLQWHTGDLGPDPAELAAAKPKWTLDVLTSLDERQLNELVTGFWQARVCTVEPAGNDLLIFRPSTGRLFGVAHCTTAKPSLDQMHSLVELVQQRAAPLGLFYAISGFTPEVLAFAKDKPLKLLSGADLLTEIGHLKPEQQQTLLERTAAGPMAAAA